MTHSTSSTASPASPPAYDEPLHFCPSCQQAIDPDVCWCGDSIKHHSWDHSPVPMGCDCHRHKEKPKPYDPFNL